MKILLVEDEEMLSTIVAKGLRNLGYAVDTVFDGEEALYSHEVNEYDLIVLDLNLPKKDGLEVLREIRQRDTDIKILILSARTKIGDRIIGLDNGANDYLIKPFDFGELEARVRNLLRRSFTQLPAVLESSCLQMDTASKKVSCDGQPLVLTRKEYGILEYLLLHKNQLVSAELLMEHVWDSAFDPFSSALRYHIHSLKKKLSDCADMEIIRTVRGQGYIIEEA